MTEIPKSVVQRREYYFQIMEKAQQLNDQLLIKLIFKKLAHLSMTSAVSASSGCIIIPNIQSNQYILFVK